VCIRSYVGSLVLSYFLYPSYHGIAGSCSCCCVGGVLERVYARWGGRSHWV
jgi:hypothetical protein